MTNFRRAGAPFGIKQADRLSHVYMIGKTGVGKSTLLEVLARQDLSAGRGFALIDPHGDLVERVHAAVPDSLPITCPDASASMRKPTGGAACEGGGGWGGRGGER